MSQWKREAHLITVGQALVEERGLLKRLAEEESGTEVEPNSLHPKKARVKVEFL